MSFCHYCFWPCDHLASVICRSCLPQTHRLQNVLIIAFLWFYCTSLHCAVFFMFILLGIYQACEICRFVVFFFFKSNPGKFWPLFFGDVFCFIRIPASWDPSHTNVRPLLTLCRWSLGLWYLQTFHFSFLCFGLSLFFFFWVFPYFGPFQEVTNTWTHD